VFVDALSEALPGLAEHGCSYREPGGFFRRMREGEGTWLGHVLEHVAIELQNIAGEAVTFGKTRSAAAPGVYTVVYEYAQRDEGVAAGEFDAALDPERTATAIVAVMQGGYVLARAADDAGLFEDAIAGILPLLGEH